ncbi:hypothetical protein [Massilia brevitalea]|uniref:hypothetical protein n=1 Tax=Massilia brevitalea TaxID=442526 RepID=UPI002738A761|nr:hypothetical protein [Massilia brevitalea]
MLRWTVFEQDWLGLAFQHGVRSYWSIRLGIGSVSQYSPTFAVLRAGHSPRLKAPIGKRYPSIAIYNAFKVPRPRLKVDIAVIARITVVQYAALPAKSFRQASNEVLGVASKSFVAAIERIEQLGGARKLTSQGKAQ